MDAASFEARLPSTFLVILRSTNSSVNGGPTPLQQCLGCAKGRGQEKRRRVGGPASSRQEDFQSRVGVGDRTDASKLDKPGQLTSLAPFLGFVDPRFLSLAPR